MRYGWYRRSEAWYMALWPQCGQFIDRPRETGLDRQKTIHFNTQLCHSALPSANRPMAMVFTDLPAARPYLAIASSF
jgi:hypothetical protein